MTERVWHSVSVIHISPHVHNVLLVAIGGRSLKALKSLLHTVLIELSEYISQYSSHWVTGTGVIHS